MGLPRAALTALVLVALGAPALGDESIEVLVQTEPPGARVSLLRATDSGAARPLENPSGQTSFLKPTELRGPEAEFLIEMPGYEAQTLRVPRDFLKPGKVRRVPPGEPVKLRVTQSSWLARLGAVGAGILLLAGIPALLVWRSARRREAQVVDLEARVGAMVVPSATVDPLVGRRLGDYWLLERVGSGGMGVVYRGAHEREMATAASIELVPPVAVKVLGEEATDAEFLARFQRELEISRSMMHPNIVRLEDFGEGMGRRYLVMELLRGRPLRESLDPQGLPVDRALEVLRPVVSALAYAHGRGVVHRDLKPDNIMVEPDGRVVVMDFGLARGKEYPTVTKTSALLGTPAYMAPEQITGGVTGPSIDQYAIGVIAYELLTGRLPFQADDAVQLIFRHLSDEPPPLREWKPDLPPDLEAAVLRMLAKDPAERYPDLAAALAALEAAAR